MSKYKRKLYDATKMNDFRDLINKYLTYSDKIAFEYKMSPSDTEHITISYKQFASDIKALATSLLNLGLSEKRVAIIAPNRYEWCTSYLAITTSNIVVVPLDRALPDNEIKNLIIRSKADAVIFDKKYTNVFSELIASKESNLSYFICMDDNIENFMNYSSLIQKGNSLLDNGDNKYDMVKIDNKKMSIMLFTSGTTSISKAVALSQSNICEDIYSLAQMTDIRKTDTFLSFLPLHHTFESTCTFLYGTFSGITVAFCDGLKYIQKNLAEFKVTGFVCVPLMLEIMYKKNKKRYRRKRKNKTCTKYD